MKKPIVGWWEKFTAAIEVQAFTNFCHTHNIITFFIINFKKSNNIRMRL